MFIAKYDSTARCEDEVVDVYIFMAGYKHLTSIEVVVCIF